MHTSNYMITGNVLFFILHKAVHKLSDVTAPGGTMQWTRL